MEKFNGRKPMEQMDMTGDMIYKKQMMELMFLQGEQTPLKVSIS